MQEGGYNWSKAGFSDSMYHIFTPPQLDDLSALNLESVRVELSS